MNVSLKTFMPVAAAGLLGLSACSDVKERAKDYMQDRPYSEYAAEPYDSRACSSRQ